MAAAEDDSSNARPKSRPKSQPKSRPKSQPRCRFLSVSQEPGLGLNPKFGLIREFKAREV